MKGISLVAVCLWLISLHAETRSTFDRMLMPDEERNTRREITDDNGLDKSYVAVVKSISKGLEQAVEECKHQFRWDLWNCPVTATSIASKSKPQTATKEVSFLQAITAAGTMYAATMSCHDKDNSLCGCGSGGKFPDTDETSGWRWGGCSHNVKFGEKVSRLFLGTEKTGTDIWRSIKSHNERAGHKAVKHTLQTFCKCHGITGSCQVRTCWQQLADFRVIGDHLKKKYKRVKPVKDLQNKLFYSNKVTHPKINRISKHDLVYSEDSPNYCETDNSIGYLGTLGRECLKIEKGAKRSSMTKFERTSCRRLCKNCGHKIGKYVIQQEFDCECEFKWCCAVDCKRCTKNVTRYYCK